MSRFCTHDHEYLAPTKERPTFADIKESLRIAQADLVLGTSLAKGAGTRQRTKVSDGDRDVDARHGLTLCEKSCEARDSLKLVLRADVDEQMAVQQCKAKQSSVAASLSRSMSTDQCPANSSTVKSGKIKSRRRSKSVDMRPSKKRFAIFLCHCQDACGAEAKLVQLELIKLLPGHKLFLGAPNSGDHIVDHVLESDCVVLFQSEGVLTRPYCLVELYTAITHRVPLVCLNVQGPSPYDYTDAAAFLEHLDTQLDIVNPGAAHIVESAGVDLVDCAYQLSQTIPATISIPFDPRGSKNAIHATMLDIQVAFKAAVACKAANTTTEKGAWLEQRSSTNGYVGMEDRSAIDSAPLLDQSSDFVSHQSSDLHSKSVIDFHSISRQSSDFEWHTVAASVETDTTEEDSTAINLVHSSTSAKMSKSEWLTHRESSGKISFDPTSEPEPERAGNSEPELWPVLVSDYRTGDTSLEATHVCDDTYVVQCDTCSHTTIGIVGTWTGYCTCCIFNKFCK